MALGVRVPVAGTFARIESTLTTLCRGLGAICERLDGAASEMSPAEIIQFLDGYRGAEAMAAGVLDAWTAVSDTPDTSDAEKVQRFTVARRHPRRARKARAADAGTGDALRLSDPVALAIARRSGA